MSIIGHPSCRSKNSPSRKASAAFTLVEMLVVIAIVAIMAAMLMPALQSAIVSSRAVVCSSNLRQTSMGMNQYSLDFHGYFVPTMFSGVSHFTENWGHILIRNSYLNDPALLSCPGAEGLSCLDEILAPDRAAWRFKHTHFGYNDYLGLGLPGHWYTYTRLSSVMQPSATIVMGDSIDYSSTPPFATIFRLESTDNPGWALHSRHNGGANILWVDSHVSWHANASAQFQDNQRLYFDLK